MKKTIFVGRFLFFLTALFLVEASVAQDVIAPEIPKAIHLVEIDQAGAAIKLLNEAITANPTNASLLYYLGYAQIKKGELDNALKSFEKGTQVDPKEALNIAGKGYVHLLKNDMVEAKRLFDEALSLSKSKNTSVLNAIAEAYLTTRKHAAEAMQILGKTKQNTFETLILLGDAYLQQNNGGGQAVSSYEKAAEIDPKRALPHYKIGVVYFRSKNIQASEEAYKKAIAVDAEYTFAYKELGEIYYVAKDGENAVKAQESYLALTENREAGMLQYAFYLFMAKKYAKANEIFKQLVLKSDVTPIVFRYYALSLIEVGETEQAVIIFGKFFAIAKKEDIVASDYAAYGKLLVKAKKDSMAVDIFQMCLALDSNQVDIWQSKGEAQLRLRRYPQTIETFKKLMTKRKAPYPADFYSIGRAYYASDKFVEADSAFSTVIRLAPQIVQTYLLEARTRSAQDPDAKKGLANPYFEKFIELALASGDAKYKKDLAEAYSYLASYSYNIKHDVPATIAYYEKVLVVKPGDPAAIENINILKKKQ